MEFERIGMARFQSAYAVYCEVNGTKNAALEKQKNSHDDYLDLRDKLEPIAKRNADKLRAAKESLKRGNSSRVSSKN